MLNVKDFGAVGDGATDDTAAIQAALDAVPSGGEEVVFPSTSTSYRHSGLIVKTSGTRLSGVGGAVPLKYNGSGAAAASVLKVDKTTYNAGNNYKDIVIEGFVIDGNNTALLGLDLKGFTRRCIVRSVYVTGCVSPLKLQDGFYSSWQSVEFGATPFSTPSGMSVATYNANLFGAYLDTCHASRWDSVIFNLIGGDSSHAYTAALRIGNSNGIRFGSTTFEEMTASVHKLSNLVVVAGQTNLQMESIYIEGVDTAAEMISLNDNAELDADSFFLNGLTAPSFLKAVGRAPIRIGMLDGENLDFSNRLFDLSSGTEFTNLTLDRISLGVGAQTGTIFDANTTAGSKKGISSAPILLDNKKAAASTGYVTSGYVVSLGSSFVDVSSGTANINGQSVGSTKNSGVSQRIYPDVSIADTWNVKLSPAGTPYLERQSSIRAESTFAATLATFSTPGAGGAPTGLVSTTFNNSRLNGTRIDLPRSTELIHRILGGSQTLIDAGVAAPGALLNLTLSPTAGEDDDLTAILMYRVSTALGATHSSETGMVSFAFNKDNGNNYVASTPSKFGSTQALDAGMTSLAVTFTGLIAGNIATLRATAETSTNANSTIHFTAFILGAQRSATAVALASGVTAAE